MPIKKVKKSKKSKIAKPKKRRAPTKKSTKSIYQKVNVNVQSGGGGGGSGGMSQPSIPHHPVPQYSHIPQGFYDKTGENVKLNNIIDLLNKQEKKLNPTHTNDPFDLEYGRIPFFHTVEVPAWQDDSISSVTDNPLDNDQSTINKGVDDIPIKSEPSYSDYGSIDSIEPYFGSYNPILNLPEDTNNKSLLSKILDKSIEEPAIPVSFNVEDEEPLVVEAHIPIAPRAMTVGELKAHIYDYDPKKERRDEFNSFLKKRGYKSVSKSSIEGLQLLVDHLEHMKTAKI